MVEKTIITKCCIAGGGPAGMMLGFLLARGGIDVVVLEKHGDFLRDFRGDTIHPSTLELMRELGLLDEFLKLPHAKVDHMNAQFGDTTVGLADLTRLPTTCQVHRLHAAMGLPEFPRRARRPLSQLPPDDEDGSDRPCLRGRSRRRRARARGWRGNRDQRRSRCRRRRPSFDAARARRLQGRGHRRADGRVVDAHLAPSRRSRPAPSVISRSGASSSCSIATITGSAPSSFRRAPPTT